MGRIRPTLHGSQINRAQLTLAEKAALAQKYGYAGVDFALREVETQHGGDADRVKALLAAHNVEPSTVGGVLDANVFASDDEFSTALTQVRERAQAVAAVGAARTGTVLWSRTMQPKDALWPVVVERIRQLDRALAGTGVRIGMEFLGVKTLHTERPYEFVQSMAEANRLLDEAGAEHVGLTLDSYHWYTGGDSLDTIRQTPAHRIVLLHINDAKAGPRDQLLDNDRLVPGEGVISLVDWLQAIAATGFDGFVGMEVLGPRLADLDAEACASIGIESLRPIYAAAGLSLTGEDQ